MIALAGSFVLSGPIHSQQADAAAPPSDPALEALEREKKIAEFKKEIAEAERDALQARLPTSDSTGPKGEVKVDDKAGYFAELMAYSTLTTAADRIAKDLAKKPGGKIIVTDEMDLAQKTQLWSLIDGRLDKFETEFKALIERAKAVREVDDLGAGPEAAGALVATLPALLGGIADIAAFFRADVELKGRDIVLAQNALVAEVASALADKWTVLLPGLNRAGTGALLTKLDGLASQRRELVGERARIEQLVKGTLSQLARTRKELAEKKAELADLSKEDPPDKNKIAAVRAEIDGLEDELVPLEIVEGDWTRLKGDIDALVTGYDLYRTAVTESTKEKPAPIESLAIVDVIRDNRDAHRLHLEIASKGAEIHLTKSAWTSGRISYVGGSVVVYFWIDGEGALKGSDSLPLWEGSSFKARNGPEQLRRSRIKDKEEPTGEEPEG